MAEVGVYYVTIMPDMSGFSARMLKELDGAASPVGQSLQRGLFSSISTSAIGVFLGNVASQAASAVMRSFADGISGGVERLDTLSVFPRIMENIGIDPASSSAAIERVRASIIGLPTALDDAARSVQRLALKTMDIDRATDIFIAFNNALVAGAAPAHLQSAALEQFAQAVSKGKTDMIEWRSLLNAMPAQLNQVAMKMGLSVDELGTGLRLGDIAMDDFLDALISLNTEGVAGFASFEEQVESATGTIGTALANAENRMSQFWEGVLSGIGQENIVSTINGITEQLPAAGQATGDFLGDTMAELERLDAVKGPFEDIAEAAGDLADEIGIDLAGALDIELPEAAEFAAKTISNFFIIITYPIKAAIKALERVVELYNELTGRGTADDEGFAGPSYEEWSARNRPEPTVREDDWRWGITPTITSRYANSILTIGRLTDGLRDTFDKDFAAMSSAVSSNFGAIDSSISGSMSKAAASAKAESDRISAAIGSIKGKRVGVDINVYKTGINGIDISTYTKGSGKTVFVNAFAAGGIISSPTFSLMGESGAEAVIPLTNRSYVRPFARAVAREMGGGGNTFNLNAREVNSNAMIRRGSEQMLYGILRKEGML